MAKAAKKSDEAKAKPPKAAPKAKAPAEAKIPPGGRPPARDGYVYADQLARIFVCTVEWLRQLAKMGVIPKAEDGQYPLIPSIQGYIRHLREEAKNNSRAATARRVGDARALEIELRIAEKQNRLIDLAEHLSVIEQLCGLFIAGLNGLPATVTRDMTLRRRIEKESNAIRSRIVAFAEKSASELAESGRTASPDAEEAA